MLTSGFIVTKFNLKWKFQWTQKLTFFDIESEKYQTFSRAGLIIQFYWVNSVSFLLETLSALDKIIAIRII